MADPRYNQIQAAAVTPNRVTSITFDSPQTVVAEPAVFQQRRADQILPESTTDVIQLKSGVWCLRPINDFEKVHERSEAHGYQMRLADFSASSIVAEIAYQRAYTELSGIAAAAATATTGDYFFSKRLPAGASWDGSVAYGLPKPAIDTTAYPLDRLMTGNATHDAQTGYLLRILVAGAPLQTPDVLFGFQFGGDISSQGYGKYWIALRGDGKALLYEWIAGDWTQVAEWRYHSPRDLPSSAIVMRIIPAFPSHIEFSTLSLKEPSNLLHKITDGLYHAFKGGHHETSGQGTYLHDTSNRGIYARAPGTTAIHPMTGPGQVAIDVRRDLRLYWQVSRLAYPATGTLTDRPFTLPENVGSSQILRLTPLSYDWYSGDDNRVTSSAAVAETAAGGSLTGGSETYSIGSTSYNVTGWNPPGGKNALRAVITLSNSESSGARWHSPVFTGYNISRNGRLQTIAPGTKTGGSLRRLSITGPGYQPDHEACHLEIEDPADSLAFLRTRGKTPVLVETTYDPTDPTKKAVLFQGWTGRVTATLKGKAGRVYPSPNWRHYDVEAVGEWDRLTGRFFYQQWDFSDDAGSPSGRTGNIGRPWKITDIIKVILASEGVAYDVFDSEMRLPTSSPLVSSELYKPTPGTLVTEYITALASGYLNAFFIFDASAGTSGMFRLLPVPSGTGTPLWNFVTTMPAAGTPKLAYRSGAYAANTSPILSGGGAGGSFRTYCVPAEANVVSVTGSSDNASAGPAAIVTQTVVIGESFDSPTHTGATPVDNLDWLGGQRKAVEWVDLTLRGQAAVDWVCRRVASLIRGRKFAEFTAELVLVQPGDPLMTVREARPLHCGDLVTLDGDVWIVHSANPIIAHDTIQLAHYELEFFRPEIALGI